MNCLYYQGIYIYFAYGFVSRLRFNSSSSSSRTRWCPQHNWPKFKCDALRIDIENSVLPNRSGLTIYQFLVFIISFHICRCRWIWRLVLLLLLLLLLLFLRLRWYQILFGTKHEGHDEPFCHGRAAYSHRILCSDFYFICYVYRARHSKWDPMRRWRRLRLRCICSIGVYPPSQPIKCVTISAYKDFIQFRWVELK